MPKRNLIWVTVTVLVACLVAWVSRREGSVGASGGADPLEPLQRLHALCDRHYYQPTPPEAIHAAMRGYLRALDPYCRYIPPQRPEYLGRVIHGRRIDLGVVYEIVDDRVRVIGSIPASPAAEAGLVAADVIVAVDGEAIERPTRKDVDKRLTGAVGSKVVLRIRRGGAERDVELTRREYPAETVTGLFRDVKGAWRFMIDPAAGVAYVRISEFVTGTADRFDEVMRGLLGEGLRSLVLDLRGNPGGPLREAVEVADRFIDDGLIVMTRSRDGDERYEAHDDRTLPDVRLVVLVDGRTVSAPEVVAGAVRRHSRGVLVGERTYGKDYIQTPFTLGDGYGRVLLTTGKYHFAEPVATTRPAATSAPAEAAQPGVEPHLPVKTSEADQRRLNWYRYCAAAAPPRKAATRPAAGQRDRRLEQVRAMDAPLARALALLNTPGSIAAILGGPAASTKDGARHE